MAHLGFVDNLLQRVGKVGDNDNCRRAAVIKLMLKLAGCVERVNVYHNHPGTQNPEQRNGVLQQVRHHQRHAIALLQAKPLLKVGGKCPAALLQFTEGHHLAHVDKRRLVGITGC